MKHILFEQGAYDGFCDWGIYDKARYIKIRDLIKACLREPSKGMGKPEPLKAALKGC